MGLFRFLLAISVFMAHISNPWWIHGFGGENAVEIFFVISGYYIATILDKSYSSNKKFYLNRMLRLYPIYYFVCFLVILRALFIPDFKTALFEFPSQVLTLVNFANSLLFGTDWVMFFQWREGGLHFGSYINSELPIYSALFIPQSWSLGIEITFYLFAPFICKLSTRLILFLGIALLGIKSIAWVNGLNKDPWSYRFFLFEMPMFIFGILLYRIKRDRNFNFSLSLKKVYLLVGITYFGVPYLNTSLNLDRKIQFACLLLVTSLIILCGKQSKLDHKIGELSYPFYISHVFVISTYLWTVNRHKESDWLNMMGESMWVTLISCLLLSSIFSMLLIRLSAPIEKLRDRNREQPIGTRFQ